MSMARSGAIRASALQVLGCQRRQDRVVESGESSGKISKTTPSKVSKLRDEQQSPAARHAQSSVLVYLVVYPAQQAVRGSMGKIVLSI